MSDTIKKLIKRIRYYDSQKADKVTPASNVRIVEGQFAFADEAIKVTDTAQRQLLSLAKIPTDFFINKLAPEEQQSVFNRLFNRELGAREFMFRFSGDTLYGIVSPRYSKLDNILIVDLLRNARESGLTLTPMSSDLNPDHARLQLIMKNGHPTTGELLPQICFTNSENGLGSLQVWAGVYRVICSNGLMVPVDTTRSRWIHSGHDPNFDLDMPAIMARSMEYLYLMEQAQVAYLTTARKIQLLKGITGSLGQSTASTIVDVINAEYHGGQTLYHVVNGITQAAQAYPASRQTELESFASRLIA